MPPILQRSLPVVPWMAEHTLRLPGTVPIAPEDWLVRDDAFAAQMAARDALIAGQPEAVHAMMDESRPAADELLARVLGAIAAVPGYAVGATSVRRPDGVEVPLAGPPLCVAGRLVQEDLCILQKRAGEDEHRLTAAILCFPSNWTLAQKLGHGLARIHLPVDRYDDGVARRVQRLFDSIRPETPLMRANLLPYSDGGLHNPRTEFARHTPPPGGARFVRVERQVLLRLPETRAVVFSIHTYVVRPADLPPDQRARLEEVRPGVFTKGCDPAGDALD